MTYQTACERQETSNFWRQMLATRRHRRRLFSLHLKWRRSRNMKCEGTKLNDSAGLKVAGLEYRRKGLWELEAKNQQVFLKLTTVTRNKVSGKTWIEELNFRLASSYLKLLLGTSMIKHRGNVQYSELECLIREQAWCCSTKAFGSFIDYHADQYRGSCSKQYLKLVRQTSCLAKYIC